MRDDELIEQSIRLAEDNARSGGMPFGAVVARDGVVIAGGVNNAVQTNDPTAHAELVAIRAACQHLATLDLAGAVVYASCQPCPMCQAAALLADVSKIFYAATGAMAAAVGFDAGPVRDELLLPFEQRTTPIVHLDVASAVRPLEIWAEVCGPQSPGP